MIHEILLPSRVIYGLGSFVEVGKHVNKLGKKALIVSDPVMEKIGHVDTCKRYLEEAGIEYAIYCGVHTEPTDQHVEEALAVCRDARCDVIVAIGGGSCIDAGKAVAVMSTNEGYIGDYVGGQRRFTQQPLPLVAVPTTAGTGSEVTKVTVIIDTHNEVKMMINQQELLPTVAIVDAMLSMSCPSNVIAASGIDALCHAIEAYLSRKAQPVSDVWALQAIDLIFRHLPLIYSQQGQPEDYANVALGAMLAGAAFSNASVTLVHGMSRPIGAIFHVPHGISNAMLLPAVLAFTSESATDRLADIGRVMKPALSSLSRDVLSDTVRREVESLCKQLNVPNLRDWGLDRESFFAAIPRMAVDAIASGSPANHPNPASAEQIEQLYKQCYDYEMQDEEQEVVKQ